MDITYLAENLPLLWRAAMVTAGLTLAVLVCSTLLALPLCVVGLVRPTAGSRLLDGAVLLLRALPSLVILFFLYYGAPQYGVVLAPMAVAILGLTLPATAYNIEIFRAGLRAVEPGQIEAARALGVPGWKIWLRIVFPQAVPIFLPTYLSNATLVLKGTSVASIITIPELTAVANQIVSETYQPFEILLAVAVMYVAMGAAIGLAAAAIGRIARRRFHAPANPDLPPHAPKGLSQ